MGLYMDVLECTSQRALFAQLDSDYSWTVMNFLILLLFESICLGFYNPGCLPFLIVDPTNDFFLGCACIYLISSSSFCTCTPPLSASGGE